MLLSSDIFNEVVYYLDHHKESLRIKKLIFCICKNYWENDLTILNSVTLNELIQELIQLKPSNDQLSFSVYKLVKTLNRSTIYDPIAKVIIEQINRLYHFQSNYYSHDHDNEEETQLITAQVKSSNLNQNYDLLIDQVVGNLATHREENRIKKLVFAVSKNQWENNVNIINTYGLKNLILDLHRTYETKENLRKSLNKIVETINKKNIYSALANLLISQLELLYEIEGEYEEETTTKVETKIVQTQIIHLDTPPINSPEKETLLAPSIKQSLANPQNFPTSIVAPENPPHLNESNLTITPPREPGQKEYNSFELRLEIMQYTNPLRAKILLFSLLVQPWEQTEQDWTTLKGYSLEDLLDQLIKSGKSVQEIETNLDTIAKSQSDVESNLQTANVIIQAISNIIE